jgi:hypothetical protein
LGSAGTPLGEKVVVSMGAQLPKLELGPQVTLLESGALGLAYFPDEGTAVLRRKDPFRLLLVSATSTFLIEAEGMESLRLGKSTEVLAPGAKGSFDNGYAGISAVVEHAGTHYAFYHAEDQEGLPGLAGGIPGFYASIGLATSTDGLTFTKRGQVLTSSQPKAWQAYPNQGDRGAAEPGAVVSKDGRYIYLYYTEHSRVEGRAVDIAMARAELGAGEVGPGSFFKYRDGEFKEPGIGGKDSPIVTAKAFPSANALEGHVTYSRAVDRYLMVYGVDAYAERMNGAPPAHSGLYLAWSMDGIAWTSGIRLIADQGVPQLGRSLSWEGTILWDDDVAQTGWLVYGYTPNWRTPPHYLVGRRLRLLE